jgi:2-C-methyl-D-erythritol 4-phosphate cytidylyltransferase
MEKYAVIVAGGSGSRMGSEVPKQFLPLAGRPVLMHTLERFAESDPHTHLVLVLPEAQIPAWQALVQAHGFGLAHRVVAGGATRFQSVRNGLALVPPWAVVAVHDGVRPFVSAAGIARCFEEAARVGSAVMAVAPKDSLRRLRPGGHSEAVERASFRIVQTPQTFRAALLQEAFRTEEQAFFTDDASVFEYAGHEVHLVEGEYRNIKITTPEDLLVAEAFMSVK